MAAVDPAHAEPSLYNGRPRPQPSAAHANPTDKHYALTAGQQEILAMLEGRPAPAAEDAENVVDAGMGLDIVFAVGGAASILAGVVLVFFFAALGSVLLVLGAILCAVAFEHVALRDLSAEEAEVNAASAATTAHGHKAAAHAHN